MTKRDRMFSFLENLLQCAKFNGILIAFRIHFHYVVSSFSLSKDSKKYRFLKFDVEFMDVQSLRNMLFELFGFNSYFFKSEQINPVIIDIGANIGDSIFYFKWLYPEAEIFAFEPHPEAFAMLKRNIKKNSFSKIHPYNVGLSDKKQIVELFVGESSILGSSTILSDVKRMDGMKEVRKIRLEKVSTLKEITKLKRIDLIKIDIEGAESSLFNDLQKLFPVTKKVIIEFHLVPEIRNNSFDNIVNLLRKHGLEPNIAGFYRSEKNEATPFGSLLIADRKV